MESSINSPASAFVYSERTTLSIDEKLLYRSSTITFKTTSDGTPLFKVKNERRSSRGLKKQIQDKRGNVLYKNQNLAFSMRGRMHIYRPSASGDEIVFHLRRKSAWSCECAETILVWKGASDEGEPWMCISGSLNGKKFEFEEVSTGKTIAVVSRKSNAGGRSRAHKKFSLTVEPGYDVALILFLAIVLHLRAVAQAQASSTYSGGGSGGGGDGGCGGGGGGGCGGGC